MLGHLNILNKLLLYIWNTLCWKTIVLLSFEQGDQFYRLDCKWWYCDEVNEVYDDDEEHCRQMTLSALCWMNVGQCQHFATLALQILRSWYEMSHILILPNEKCLYWTQVSLGSGLLVPVSLTPSNTFWNLTDDEKRWLAIGHGKDKNYECQWDTEAELMVQTNIPIPKVLY